MRNDGKKRKVCWGFLPFLEANFMIFMAGKYSSSDGTESLHFIHKHEIEK